MGEWGVQQEEVVGSGSRRLSGCRPGRNRAEHGTGVPAWDSQPGSPRSYYYKYDTAIAVDDTAVKCDTVVRWVVSYNL